MSNLSWEELLGEWRESCALLSEVLGTDNGGVSWRRVLFANSGRGRCFVGHHSAVHLWTYRVRANHGGLPGVRRLFSTPLHSTYCGGSYRGRKQVAAFRAGHLLAHQQSSEAIDLSMVLSLTENRAR